jgi:iron complex transport system ATP-binding protein
MRLTGVTTFANRAVDTLSGGERQRVWLAMLVAQDARILLLDEPTSALDIAHQVEVLSLIRELGRQRNASTIVVLHDINMAARYADRIFALKKGRLIAAGSPEEIMEAGTLQTIFGVPMALVRNPETGQPIAHVA